MSPTLRSTFRNLISPKNTISTLILSFIYFSFSILILNYKLLLITFLGDYPLSYKITLPFTLLGGIWSAFSLVDSIILITTSIVFGMNLLLIIKLINVLRKDKKVSLSFGGSTVLALISTGCGACGLSILSFLGLFSSLAFIPFGGFILHSLSLLLLFLSLLYSLKTYHEKIVCKI